MNSRIIYICVSILVFIVIIIYPLLRGSDDFVAEINKKREKKNDFMKSSSESPFVRDKQNFKGLNYFPPDINYRISAKLIPIENKKKMLLTTNDGVDVGNFVEYAFAEFKWRDTVCKLLILELTDGVNRGELFLAFADSTSARETYGSGRYLDLKKVSGASSILLDFNQAYNPYCAYSPHYTCPFPPPENILTVAIRAGEKKYRD